MFAQFQSHAYVGKVRHELAPVRHRVRLKVFRWAEEAVIETGYLALELRELLTCPSLHCRLLHTVLPGSKRHSEGGAGEAESLEDATREYGIRRTSTMRGEIRNYKTEL